MNYAKIYNQIIERRLLIPFDGYTESHHIIPKSLGGSDLKDNLVNLTAREHFLCHWILVKMHMHNKNSYHKMIKAFGMMLHAHTSVQDRHKSRLTSRIFEKYRTDLSESMSALQQGDKNSQYGTRWICNLEEQVNKKIPSSNTIPDGWMVGRNKWLKKPATPKPKKIRDRRYKNGYKVSVNGVVFDSISQAADALRIGHETARMRFKSRSFPEYVIMK